MKQSKSQIHAKIAKKVPSEKGPLYDLTQELKGLSRQEIINKLFFAEDTHAVWQMQVDEKHKADQSVARSTIESLCVERRTLTYKVETLQLELSILRQALQRQIQTSGDLLTITRGLAPQMKQSDSDQGSWHLAGRSHP